MRRNWGITAELIDRVPEALLPVFELLALPGDLFVIVGVLGLLSIVDVYRNGQSPDLDQPLWSPRLVFIVAIVVGGLAFIVLLESAFGLSRPPASWQAIPASPYAFPSGHTMAATVCWGALAWWYGRRTTQRLVGVVVLVATVGLARMALGVHYLPDILAGVGFGVLYLALVGYFADESPGRAFVIATATAVSAVLITGGSSRSLVALGGVAAALVGWLALSHSFVRTGGKY